MCAATFYCNSYPAQVLLSGRHSLGVGATTRSTKFFFVLKFDINQIIINQPFTRIIKVATNDTYFFMATHVATISTVAGEE